MTSTDALDILSADEASACLPASVLAMLHGTDITVFRVPDDASDTAACSERYGIELDDCANTIVVRFKRDGACWWKRR
jgi:prolyl-tRNA editing enzyme YbaK/EbsC (Cys-tRNA(Pro) deacylase)